ncbi:signal peptidase II [Halanaerobiaceae bacterium Z-7014]|uniref:Lipoprotein signal peptidase n=1 Tax=Halonatronomonas betaini TaxID=2778430 RepID=A0A931F8D6_9FIRM|nr:signal peptidase II [Halonatronomonas betaini]MBF8437621.1 signal peptidase II [Halonatronomonas betaini]
MIKFGVIFLLLIGIDQLSKFYIENTMFIGESRPLIEGIFHITYVRNTGISFGLLADRTGIILIIQLFIIILLFYLKSQVFSNNFYINLFFVFVFAGATGNILDRLIYGYVIDFFDFQIWPVFNFADIYIVLGVLGLILFIFKFEEL